jgi:hypothetical protein
MAFAYSGVLVFWLYMESKMVAMKLLNRYYKKNKIELFGRGFTFIDDLHFMYISFEKIIEKLSFELMGTWQRVLKGPAMHDSLHPSGDHSLTGLTAVSGVAAHRAGNL